MLRTWVGEVANVYALRYRLSDLNGQVPREVSYLLERTYGDGRLLFYLTTEQAN